MVLRRQLLTENDCYRKGEHMDACGVMLHATGAENPDLRRYVGPDDGFLGGNPNGNHWNRPGVGACVHAFIGRAKDGSVAVYQTLPWDMRGWHCGKGAKGSANNTHIGIELCEDDRTDGDYFLAVYRAAAQLTAMLCREKELDPMAPGVVIDHAEGHQRGIASNHADVGHWFRLYGKTMDQFRADVAKEMEGPDMTEEQVRKIVGEEWKKLQQAASDMPPSPWAQEGVAEARARGITDGSRPRSLATREEVMLMVNAAVKSK